MATPLESPASGMELRDLLEDPEFTARPPRPYTPEQPLAALRRLLRVLSDDRGYLLQELVEIARDFCGADSAGISLEEPDPAGGLHFRWVAVVGTFARYRNGTAPRFFSPCGTCLTRGRPQLFRVTQPYYDFLGIEAEPITDGMLIPWFTEGERGTIWAVAHGSPATFTLADYGLLRTLADFVSIAIRQYAREKALLQTEKNLASIARANELAHQINNPLQALTNTLFLVHTHLMHHDPDQARACLDLASAEVATLSEQVARLLNLKGRFTPAGHDL